uniref:Uncharacterized protein n=1 Tax=Physcomitrium patens TaxID=3218 RepID=A0A2K1JH82_PHYPA|nr:hypothetical protein PHYPA_018282 [Physcomitrium patens]
MAMTTDHALHDGGWFLRVVVIIHRCAVDLFEAAASCRRFWQSRGGLAAAACERMLRWMKPFPGAGLWDIDGGLQGPAIRWAEMGKISPPHVLEDVEL